LNLSYFISSRTRVQQGSFSSAIHKIAVASIAIGLAAAIVSFLVFNGFEKTVKEKVFSFSAHLQVNQMSLSNSTEEPWFSTNIDLYNHPETFDNVAHVQEYAHKAGLIKGKQEVLGVVLKGVGRSFDQRRFQESMVEGSFINFSDSGYSREVVISRQIANKMNLAVGDRMIIHFFQNPPRFRNLKVSGIYETNLSDYYDSKIILGDIGLIRRLNDWPDSLAGGLQVYVKDDTRIDETVETIGERMDFDLLIEKTSDKFYQVFEWLQLISRQVKILLAIILIVVCVNMISVVLIMVMERTPMIGTLKALGAPNRLVRSVFIYQGIHLIVRGLVLGNVIGLGLCFLQYQFKIIKLNPHNYYMSYVPIGWDWLAVGLLNLLVFGTVALVLMLPSGFVSRINPIKAIRFD